MAVIQIKRNTTNNDAPTGLLPGELAYVEGSNILYIGNGQNIGADGRGDAVIIKPEFIVYAETDSPDQIILKDAGDKSYILSVSDALDGNVTYSLPPAASVGTQKILVSDADGNLSYGSVDIEKLEDIGNVEDDPENNEILIYDSNAEQWVGTDPATLKDSLTLDTTDDQVYNNLHLLGTLEVKGDSVQLNSSNLAIRDKMIGVGATKGILHLKAYQTGNTVTILGTENDISSLETDEYIFVGEGYTDPDNIPNIPSGYYQITKTADVQFESAASNEGAGSPVQFDLVISERSTDDEIDNSGLVFPGSTKKSLLWKHDDDRFVITGGDLRISGDNVYLTTSNTEEKIIDNSSKEVTGIDIDSSQVTGAFDGGVYE